MVLGRIKLIIDERKFDSSFPDYALKLDEDDSDFDLSYDGLHKSASTQITEIPSPEDIGSNIDKPENIWDQYKKIVEKKLTHDFG